MERDFLYIDILGFTNMVKEHSPKILQIFDIINGLSAHDHYAFRSIVFRTLLLFTMKTMICLTIIMLHI